MNSKVFMELLKNQKGDKEAKDKLVSLNLGLVWSIVKRFNNRGTNWKIYFKSEVLVVEGNRKVRFFI